MRWMDEWLSDRELGGFYASQDADYSLEDDGDYFTWTLAEAEAVLSADEIKIAGPYFDIGEVGEMHHNPRKNVLHVNLPLDAVAKSAGVPPKLAGELLASAKAKLDAARRLRPTPYVDKTIYAGWNAMCISAYLEAGRVLGEANALAFAVKSLDRMLAAAWDGEHLGHVVAYGEGLADGPSVAGILDDYVFAGHAALDAWEATGEMRYFETALALAEVTLAKFYDSAAGAFFDMETAAEGEVRLGALSARRKPLQDSPTPAGNSVAAALLLRLEALTGREEFAAKAQATLECFAGVVEHLGLYAASYGLALRRMIEGPVQVCVIGDDALAAALEFAALRRYAVNKSVLRLTRSQLAALPPALAQTLPHLPAVEGSFAVVCSGFSCLPPVTAVEALAALLTRSV
jgi:uncharacterized protein YyaL (SSP411 family)